MKQNLREPTINEISEEIGIEKEMIVYAMDAIQSPVSLFEPVYSEGGDTLYVMDQISDKKNREDRWIEDLSLREAMNHLGERERHIIQLRFYEGKTQTEVAKEVGISQAQVSRLEKGALKIHAELSSSLTQQKSSPTSGVPFPFQSNCLTYLQIYFSAFSISLITILRALIRAYFLSTDSSTAMVQRSYLSSEAFHLLQSHIRPTYLCCASLHL